MGAPALSRQEQLAAASAALWVVVMGLRDGQLLHSPMSGGAWTLSGTTWLERFVAMTWITLSLVWRRLVRWRLRVIALSGIGCFSLRARLFGTIRRIATILALPRCAAARRTGAVGRILIEPFVRGLEIGKQLCRQ
jgi:hypothetical protein